MKIIVISDSHGINREDLVYRLEDEGGDLLIHLGDYVEDGEKIAKELGIPYAIVKGNGDFNSTYPEDRLLNIKNKRIFLTHGHKYDIVYSLNSIYYKALELGADIALFGHSHKALNIIEKDIIIMNPGSTSLPRDLNKVKSYGIIEIGEKIETRIVEIN